MRLIASGKDFNSEKIKGRYVFLDNDYLSFLFNDPEILNESVEYFNSCQCYLMIDPLTRLEFLRGVFIPEQSNLKEKFISEGLFSLAINHHEVFNKIQENFLIFSKIYAQNGIPKVGTIDLLLAARVALQSNNSVFATSNKKYFPSFLFDILNVLNFEQADGTVRSVCILCFSKKKFDYCYEKLLKLEKKNK